MNTIDRDAVIEECAKVCEGMFIGQHGGVRVASLRCAGSIRALKSQPSQPDPRDEALRLAEDAIKDLRSGLLYIRQTHGDLYGVGWDRAESKAYKALAAIDATSNKEPLMQIPPLADGETYIGAIGDAAGNLQHIILLPGDNDDSTWQSAMAWAQSIGGDLPTRIEQAMLWANHRDQFQKDWYWSNETYYFESSRAWYQDLVYGTQGFNCKVYGTCRARAVRRLPI